MRTHPVAGFLFVCLAVSTSWAQPLGTAFTYQGRLKNGGSPANGSFNMDFKLYAVPVGGTVLASQTLPGISVSDGLFTVQVDFGPGVFDGNQRWLDVTVNGSPLLPRQELKAAPYAHLAINADRLDGLDSIAFLQSIPVPLTLSGTSATHIIRGANASTGGGSMGVLGLSSAASGPTFGVQGRSESTEGKGVYGFAPALSGPTYGVLGETYSTGGRGISGLAFAGSGLTYGVHGQSASTDGRGVYGLATAVSGTTYGGYFEATASAGTGVYGAGGFTGVRGESSSTDGRGVFGVSNSTSGLGVVGFATASSGNTYGVIGQSASTDGRGVAGFATANGGDTYGGHFESYSDSGTGVYGNGGYIGVRGNGLVGVHGNGNDGGVVGQANGLAGFGLSGNASGTSGRGVYGLASADNGATYGGYFQTNSTGPNSTGVFGWATAASGTTYGVWGQSQSTDGFGVIGINDRIGNTITYGVYGRSGTAFARGVYGLATAGSGNPIGVLGECTGIGFGLYAVGNSGASGVKSFHIDHPDDPENKYLLHYSTESPEVLNAYSGTIVLDATGEAVVELPRYFAKINKDPRYTLTAVGAPMPMLHVAKEIDEAALIAGARAAPGVAASLCSFRIAGGAPGAKVSWEVKALRNDRWVQQRGAPVEVEKQDPERGKYQHPELYGQPSEKGMNYEATRPRPDPEHPVPPTPAESVTSTATETMPR